MAPSVQQVKVFANGVKSVLTRAENPTKSSVLRIFDKNNCLLAEREIINNKQFLEKLSYKATPESDGVSFAKKYLLKIRQPESQRIIREADYCDSLFPSYTYAETGGYPLALREIHKGLTKGRGLDYSDNRLYKMFKQWSDLRTTNGMAKTPKPMKLDTNI